MDEQIVAIIPTDYFPSLGEIPQPPKTLRMRGTLAASDGTLFIGVVGSRKFTSYGKQACISLIKGLAGYPVTIVSGLALGIDGIAHQAAIDERIHTIAIPGSGLSWDVLYPLQHKTLAQDILQNGGALLSEFKDSEIGAPWNFPKRNRLIAGICAMIIVIEAEEKSGTLITARLATDYNKIVGAVPGPITSSTSKGAHQLLKLGAVPITDATDILRELGLDYGASRSTRPTCLLTDEEEKIVSILHDGPKLKDHIMTELELEPSSGNMTFSTLEIKGVIREVLGLVELVK